MISNNAELIHDNLDIVVDKVNVVLQMTSFNTGCWWHIKDRWGRRRGFGWGDSEEGPGHKGRDWRPDQRVREWAQRSLSGLRQSTSQQEEKREERGGLPQCRLEALSVTADPSECLVCLLFFFFAWGGYQCHGDGGWQERLDFQGDQQIPRHAQGSVSHSCCDFAFFRFSKQKKPQPV